MLDLLKSGAKTAAQYVAAVVLAWLTAVGIDVPADAIETVFTALFVGVVAIVSNFVLAKLQGRFEFLSKWIPGYNEKVTVGE